MKEQKTALVIGASRGIGRSIALRLASDGFRVFASCRNPEKFEATAGLIRSAGGECIPLVFDVTDRKAIAEEYAKYFRGDAPDAFVFNAGITKDDFFPFMTPEEWDSVLRTNLDGFYNTLQPLAGNMMLKKNISIVAVSSVSGQTGQLCQANYSASKAGLLGAVFALARELGRKNIRVNAVAPGVIETDMTKDMPKEKLVPLIPLGRFGKPEEVATVVSFLCGPDSAYVHGQVIAVNGGLYV